MISFNRNVLIILVKLGRYIHTTQSSGQRFAICPLVLYSLLENFRVDC